MKNGESYSRRRFLLGMGALAITLPFLEFCRNKTASALVWLTGTRHVLGHRLWTKDFPKPSITLSAQYLIVGGGISGLSAARQWAKDGISDFILVEMEDHLGGNASNGENRFSKYPLGAHYLPLPNKGDYELIAFLKEEGIIVGFDEKGLPQFDETQLVFAPDERLFFRNSWQEGLVPRQSEATQGYRQTNVFFNRMAYFREQKDANGRYWFDLPVSKSSSDKTIRSLDTHTMKSWMLSEGFTDPLLLEYVNYCCRDDFGLGIDGVSAWAGIHYFAGRKHNSGRENSDTVLTWPEGNARLATHLSRYVVGKTLKRHLVYEVRVHSTGVTALAYDEKEGRSVRIEAGKVLMATPQFVNRYLFRNRRANGFTYSPWLLATLTVEVLPDNGSQPLSWDNVIQGAKGLGYIYDQHQSLGQTNGKQVITYYHSFADTDTRKSRKELYEKGVDYWKKFVFDDLRTAHPDIEERTSEIRIHRLGHGMVSPVPGFIFGEERKAAAQPIEGKVFFAHTDLSGISVFEEAFHQGIDAAKAMQP
ncbi:MAG TPA: NAD(P)-binding protein [Flavobacterium sp.]|nr:NAD(P)-binding protein [Flavobacterium sp.]